MKKCGDFKLPFPWIERRAVLHERLLYIPNKIPTGNFQFSGWAHPDYFGNSNPIHIEYCSGNGAWIAAKAKDEPNVNFLAVEWDFDRARKIWTKIHNQNLPNLVVAWAEGFRLTQELLPSESVTEISINFPDPWPKRRHARYRLIQPPFVQEMARILKKNGTITFVTDDETYATSTIKDLRGNQQLESDLPDPYFVEASQEYGSSFFNELWRSKGKFIRLLRFRKK